MKISVDMCTAVKYVLFVTVVCFDALQTSIAWSESHIAIDTETPSPLVTTPSNGMIRGVRVFSKMGRTIDAFIGIPFAQPPVGNLRFKRPQPVKKHTGELNATRARPGCLQLEFKYGKIARIDNTDTTEDCLHLNVFAPGKSESAREYEEDSEDTVEDERLPVFIYLYGGAFIWGENQLSVYDGVEFAAEADAIFVAVNYRVNIFGFLNSTTSAIPGNMALWDQLMAMQWVRDNIAAFGGDPNEVTLGGQSAGAMSAAFHSYSPLSKGLFKRAFMMSGTSLSAKFTQQTTAEDMIQAITLALDCFDADPAVSIKCVLDKPITYRELEGLKRELGTKWYNFAPHSGDALLPYPIQELHRNKYHIKDMMLGVTQREGDFLFNALQEWLPNLAGGLESSPESTIRLLIKMLFGVSIQDTGRIFKAYLLPTDKDPLPHDRLLQVGSDIVSHGIFECPAQFFAEHAASQGVNVRYYVYAHMPSFRINLNLGRESTHNDDIPFLLGSINAVQENIKAYGMKTPSFFIDVQKKTSPEEHHFSRVIVKQISHFMKTGKPRIPDSQKEWPLYSAEDPQIVYIAPNNFTIVREPKTDKCSLWEPYILVKSKEGHSKTTLPKTTAEEVPSIEADESHASRRDKVGHRMHKRNQSAASVLVSSSLLHLLLLTTLLLRGY